MSRLPIRVRLTLAFAIATAGVLALAGGFVYLRVSNELNDSIDEGLQTRVGVLATRIADVPPGRIELGTSEDPEDSFSQIIGPDGAVVDSTSPSLVDSVLAPEELTSARNEEVGVDVGPLPGVDGDARLLTRAVERDGERFVAVAGVATQDRDQTLAGLAKTFAIAAPLALLLASAAGYGLATVAMRPVERMRRQAGEITLERTGERLPLPASRDEINRLGRTLNDMLERIEGSFERERSFVADASHELRTPLAILRSELELGKRPDRDLDETRAAIESAEQEVERLQGLTDDLLTLARSDASSLQLEREPVDVAAMLDRLRSRFEPRAALADRPIVIGAASPALAELDAARVEGALGNLLENALRHGAGTVTLSAREEGDAVAFEVADEGDGFPEDFAERAFERFARAESGRTTTGYGLGLAIVSAVARAHGGSVGIDPTGFGATVVLRIPKG